MNIKITSKFGWPIIIILSAIPCVLWLTMYPVSARFDNVKNIMTSMGQALGLAGLAMFALNLVLGARLKWVEGIFGGMNKVYVAHHIFGGLAFVLLLIHPIFLSLRYIVVGAADQVVKIFLLSGDPSTLYGLIGLGIMIVTLIITFYMKLPYQIWKFTHKFLGLAFFFGGLHALTIHSDISDPLHVVLRYYMIGIICIGGLAILYRTILPFLLVSKVQYKVKEIRRQGPAVVEIIMEAIKKSIRYTPGQFLFIGFSRAGLGEVHPFSITSSPADETLAIGVKALGDYTKKLLELQPGDIATIEGPFGRSSYVYYPNPHQVWIAGGIGVTPFLGMARSLKATDPYQIEMYYSLIDRSETPFLSELQDIAAQKPNFKLFAHFAKEAGYLTAEIIKKQSGPLSQKDIFLCGPPPMMKGLKLQFKDMHIPATHVHSEEFSL